MTGYSTKWVKAPSVYTGGKAFFWTRSRKGKRYWVVWNRSKRKWEVSVEKIGGSTPLAYYTTPEAGKKFVDSL